MEEDLKIFKVEYLSNHWSDFPQILNISSGDQTKIKNPQMEDNLKILKVEYLSYWLDLSPILNLSIGIWFKITCLKGRRPPMEEDLKI